jgi:membrane protease YdiL (CAAX protease family)
MGPVEDGQVDGTAREAPGVTSRIFHVRGSLQPVGLVLLVLFVPVSLIQLLETIPAVAGLTFSQRDLLRNLLMAIAVGLAWTWQSRTCPGFSLRDWRWKYLGIGVSTGILWVSIEASAARMFHYSDKNWDLEPSRYAMIHFAIAAVLIAPVVEEIVYRGLIIRAYRNSGISATWQVLVSSLLFVAIHLRFVNIPSSLEYLFAAVILALLAIRTGSLWPGIVFHAVSNGLTLLMSGK